MPFYSFHIIWVLPYIYGFFFLNKVVLPHRSGFFFFFFCRHPVATCGSGVLALLI